VQARLAADVVAGKVELEGSPKFVQRNIIEVKGRVVVSGGCPWREQEPRALTGRMAHFVTEAEQRHWQEDDDGEDRYTDEGESDAKSPPVPVSARRGVWRQHRGPTVVAILLQQRRLCVSASWRRETTVD